MCVCVCTFYSAWPIQYTYGAVYVSVLRLPLFLSLFFVVVFFSLQFFRSSGWAFAVSCVFLHVCEWKGIFNVSTISATFRQLQMLTHIKKIPSLNWCIIYVYRNVFHSIRFVYVYVWVPFPIFSCAFLSFVALNIVRIQEERRNEKKKKTIRSLSGSWYCIPRHEEEHGVCGD